MHCWFLRIWLLTIFRNLVKLPKFLTGLRLFLVNWRITFTRLYQLSQNVISVSHFIILTHKFSSWIYFNFHNFFHFNVSEKFSDKGRTDWNKIENSVQERLRTIFAWKETFVAFCECVKVSEKLNLSVAERATTANILIFRILGAFNTKKWHKKSKFLFVNW